LNVIGIAEEKLHALYPAVLKHLRERDILAKGGSEVQPVAFRGEKLHRAFAVVYGVKKALRFPDILDLHGRILLPFPDFPQILTVFFFSVKGQIV